MIDQNVAIKKAIDEGKISKELAINSIIRGMEMIVIQTIRAGKVPMAEFLADEVIFDKPLMAQLARLEITEDNIRNLAINYTKPEVQAKIMELAPKIVVSEKIGRNVPCPCGSGKKYKKCCGR